MDRIKTDFAELQAEEQRLLRFVTAGNAGGVVASLSLTGTIFGISGGGPIPVLLFWILVFFVLGLGSAWASIAIDRKFKKLNYWWHHEEGDKHHGIRHTLRNLEMWQRRMYWVSTVCLIVGIIGGLVQLYSYT